MFAQSNITMYSMNKLAQSHYENPAYFANGKFYFGLGLGNHSIGVNHSGFIIDRVFTKRAADDSLELNQSILLKSLNKVNHLNLDMRNELLGIGFNIKKNYFSLSIFNRLMVDFAYPKDLLVLAVEGNGKSLMGTRASLDGLGINLNGYIEYALGYNREITQKLRIGTRLKILSGYANFTTKKSKLGITTDQETFDWTIDGQFKFSASGLAGVFDTSSKKLNMGNFDPMSAVQSLYSFKNFGFGIDLGATYEINKKFEVSASVLDLGMIHWKESTVNYQTDNLDFRFEGVDLNQYLNDSTEYFTRLTDTLLAKVDNDIQPGAYTSGLNTRFYLGAKYNVNQWLSIGVTSFNQIIGRKFRSAFILSGTFQLRNWLGLTANYNIYGGSWANIGLGLSLRGGPIQFFVMTDNILAINYLGVKNIHASFGINLLIGKMNKYTATKSKMDRTMSVDTRSTRKKKKKK